MSVLSSDSRPEIEALQIKFIRNMPAWKKLAILDGLNEAVKILAISGIRERDPNASPQEMHRILAELMLGTDLAQKVYGHAR